MRMSASVSASVRMSAGVRMSASEDEHKRECECECDCKCEDECRAFRHLLVSAECELLEIAAIETAREISEIIE